MAINNLICSHKDNHSSSSSTPSSPVITVNPSLCLSSVNVDVSIESVARYFGGNGYAPDTSTSERIRRCIDAASEMIGPKATYTLFPISSITSGEQVILENGYDLSLPECCVDQVLGL